MQVVACPLCATTDAVFDDVAQFIDVVDVPVIIQRRFLSCSSWTRWLTCPLCSSTGVSLPEQITVEVPQLQCRCLLAQFIDGCGRPCDHADSVHHQSRGHSCCTTETGTQLPAVWGMAAVKEFLLFLRIFRAPPGCPGVERQFLSPR